LAAIGAGGLALGAAAAAAGTPGGVAPAGLHVASSVAVPHAKGSGRLVTAEASNGAVAIAVPRTPTTDDIEVGKPGRKPTLFATVPHGTVAMTFSPTALFIAGPQATSSISRSSGAVIRTWQIKVKAVEGAAGALIYGAKRIWAVGDAEGLGRRVFEIKPSSQRLISVGSGKNVLSLAAGPRGVYFVVSGGHTLTRVSAGGTRTSAPTRERVNELLSGHAALQAIAVEGHTLIVVHAFGQGLDAALVRYNANSLKHLTSAATDDAHADVVPTKAGNLALIPPGLAPGCGTSSTKTCVVRIVTKTAATSAASTLPAGDPISPLLGPDPAVVIGHAGHARLVRLS
jgi:hypothetical protein